MAVIYLLLLYILANMTSVYCERQDLHHMLYESFPNAVSCFRLLNGTHQFGCYSDPSGSLGVVHIIKKTEDLNWLLSSEAVAGPYMAVLSPHIFSSEELMTKLRLSDKVSGVLIATNGTSDRPAFLSPDDTCPNRYSGLPGTCTQSSPKWNLYGASYILKDWGKPMFFVNDPDVVLKIYQCFERFNVPLDNSQKERNLCSLQMKGHMYAAVDTPTCIKRSNIFSVISPVIYCDPMGDRNIVSTLFPLKKASEKSLIVVMTRLDTATMFDNLAPGAMSAATGIVTMLATAKLLSEMIPYDNDYERNVMFIMFSGESYDYIGSSRAVYDIINKQFPTKSHSIDLKDIGVLFEINQLDISRTVYLHHNNTETKEGTLLQNFSQSLKKFSSEYKIDVSDVPIASSASLPPLSVQSFLKSDSEMPYLILSNYKDEFKNKYYSSMFDNATNVQYTYINGTEKIPYYKVQATLADLATTLTRTLYGLVTNKTDFGDARVKPEFVDDLLHCYLETRQCQIFKENFPNERAPLETSSFYVGVARSNNIIVTLTQSTLAFLTGNVTKLSIEGCSDAKSKDDGYDYLWITGKSGQGECVKSTSRFTIAISPAFEIPDYDWKSGEYSTWSESVWQDLSLRMFLKPSRHQEIMTLIAGIIVLVFSFVIVYWFREQSSIFFHAKPGVVC